MVPDESLMPEHDSQTTPEPQESAPSEDAAADIAAGIPENVAEELPEETSTPEPDAAADEASPAVSEEEETTDAPVATADDAATSSQEEARSPEEGAVAPEDDAASQDAAAESDQPEAAPRKGGAGTVLGLKFRDFGQLYFFTAGDLDVTSGDHVLVTTEQGLSLGQVCLAVDSREEIPEDYRKDLGNQALKPVDRLATPADMDRHAQNQERGKEAWHVCRQLVREHKLDMKLVDVEVLHDQSKMLFYFTAPNRIDFRELVKDLVKEFHTRIELRQIGVRHETQMTGAIGNCGLVCCCRQFLRKFAPVTIKMAKEQNLFLNPTKISGMCGRLLCCLSYEQENYEKFHKQCPKIGKKYLTTIGSVKVLRANFFRNSLSVYVEGDEEKEIPLEDWEAMEPRRPDPNQQQQQQKAQADRARKEGGERAGRPGGRDRKVERPRPDKPRKERLREERRQQETTHAQESQPAMPADAATPPAEEHPATGESKSVFGLNAPPAAAGSGDAGGEDKPKKSSRNRRRKRRPKGKRGGGEGGSSSGGAPPAADG